MDPQTTPWNGCSATVQIQLSTNREMDLDIWMDLVCSLAIVCACEVQHSLCPKVHLWLAQLSSVEGKDRETRRHA